MDLAKEALGLVKDKDCIEVLAFLEDGINVLFSSQK